MIKDEEIEKVTFTTKDLDSEKIKQICDLKDSYWEFGYAQQLDWFKKNIQENDIHNLLYLRNNLVSYTALRKRICKISYNETFDSNYLLFDTCIVRKDFRSIGIGNHLMHFNCKIILQQKTFSILICEDNLLDFYKNFGWNRLENEKITFHNHSFSTNAMIFNEVVIDNSAAIPIENLSFELDLGYRIRVGN